MDADIFYQINKLITNEFLSQNHFRLNIESVSLGVIDHDRFHGGGSNNMKEFGSYLTVSFINLWRKKIRFNKIIAIHLTRNTNEHVPSALRGKTFLNTHSCAFSL